jgi:hypothetical protein
LATALSTQQDGEKISPLRSCFFARYGLARRPL